MVKPEDLSCLARIRARYHSTLLAAALKYNHRVELLAGILMRESRGGESRLLKDVYGTPDDPADDLGDAGHGHGLMQIDDRSFREFCAGEDWKDPAKNIMQGARVLDGKRRYLAQRQAESGAAVMTVAQLERAAIAAYNCGEGNVLKSWIEGEDVDAHTTGRDYSRNVLEFAEAYAQLLQDEQAAAAPLEPVQPAEAPQQPQAATGGLIAALWQLFQKLFGKKLA